MSIKIQSSVTAITSAELFEAEPGSSEAAGIPAALPGDVHSALHAAGRIADPLGPGGAEACGWVAERPWRYRFTLPELGPIGPEGRRRLVFQGLDTNAVVSLDGVEVARHRNMFRPLSIDLGETARVVEVRFDPVTEVPEPARPFSGAPERLLARKAQFGWGWDWAPRLPSAGIWRPVEVRTETRAAIRSVHATTLEIDRAAGAALVKIAVEVDAFAASGAVEARIELAGMTVTAPCAGSRATAYLRLPAPRLWWPHDLGEPHLYDLSVALLDAGEEVDATRQRVGVRTVELDQGPDPDEPGTRFFRFVVNGVPIFARGANWVPPHSLPGGVTADLCRRLVALARDGGMNMLRIWGGGWYEDDGFYDACDEAGVLVWQDFMFACADYPEDDPRLRDEVVLEARHQVRRLRSRACLALWCGNNESQWLHDAVARSTQPPERAPGSDFYAEILPQAVAEHDGRTPYWPGSPYGGDDHNSMSEGDRHNWQVWHGFGPRRFGEAPQVDFSPEGIGPGRYLEDAGRFISEFGICAAANRPTLLRVVPEAERRIGSPAVRDRYRDRMHAKLEWLLEASTGAPRDLGEYIEFTQAVQADGLKLGIDHFRRRWPHCAGTLVWQLNDCWPAISWSLIDHDGLPKAGYDAVRRAYAPVVASFAADGHSLQAWVVNNTTEDLEDVLVVESLDYAGGVTGVATVPAAMPALSSRRLLELGEEAVLDPGRYLRLRSTRGLFGADRWFPVPRRQRPLPAEPPRVEPVAGRLALRIRASHYTPLVRLDCGPAGVGCSDNSFDLDAGEERIVTIAGAPGGFDLGQVEVRWLYDRRVTDTAR